MESAKIQAAILGLRQNATMSVALGWLALRQIDTLEAAVLVSGSRDAQTSPV